MMKSKSSHNKVSSNAIVAPTTNQSFTNSGNKRFWIYGALFIGIIILYILLIIKFMSKNHSMSLHAATSNHVEKRFGGLYGSEQEVHETTKLLKSISHDIHELTDRSHDVLRGNLSPKQYSRIISFQQHSENVDAPSRDMVDTLDHSNSVSEKSIDQNEKTVGKLSERHVTPVEKEAAQMQISSPTGNINTDPVPLQDFSSNPKYPPAIEFTTISDSHMMNDEEKAVLIVGGTDGSGTRRVVQILTELGVTMVSEDPETYDIHADLVGGWPTIVKPVIKQMRSLDYDPSLFESSHPKEYKKSAEDLTRLLNQVERDSHKPTSYRLAIGGVLPKPDKLEANRVKYGFKAPVSMTLLPYWVHLLPHTKFVHVLRDGRDIAFSVNQGPVEKFYDDMYGHDTIQPPVKAIKLWSDWNSQIYQWSKRYVESQIEKTVAGKSTGLVASLLRGGSKQNHNNGDQEEATSDNNHRSFSYIAVHTEDTVSESRAIRFSAIHHLAKFVGSTISNDQICCMAVESMEFMGSHDRSQVDRKNQQKQVSSRYGKWRKKTEKNPSLLNSLYAVGGVGLKTFGYDPMRILPEDAMVTEDGYHCNFEPKDCNYEKKSRSSHSSEDGVDRKPEEYAIAGTCEITAGVDYKGDDLESVQFDIQDPTACCRLCKEKSDCKYFTIDPTRLSCYLKFGNSNSVENDRLISGKVIR